MTILCIETSTSVCSAAVWKDGRVVEQRISREGGNHARLLPRFIDDLMNNGKQKGNQPDAVALSCGPGSYTGLRIGTSTAKGICYGLRIPLVPVPTLQILSAAAGYTENINSEALLCPMIDARRMEVYTAWYDTHLQPLSGVRAVVVENENSLLPTDRPGLTDGKQVFCFGDGAAKCAGLFNAPGWHYIPSVVPEAQYMGALAMKMIEEGKCLTENETAYYEPFYLKDFVAAQSHVKGLK